MQAAHSSQEGDAPNQVDVPKHGRSYEGASIHLTPFTTSNNNKIVTRHICALPSSATERHTSSKITEAGKCCSEPRGAMWCGWHALKNRRLVGEGACDAMRQQCVSVCVCGQSLCSPLGTAVDDTHCVASLQNVLLRPPQELLGRSITAYNGRSRSVSSGSRRGGGERAPSRHLGHALMSQCGSVCTSPLLGIRGHWWWIRAQGDDSTRLGKSQFTCCRLRRSLCEPSCLRRRGWLWCGRSCNCAVPRREVPIFC